MKNWIKTPRWDRIPHVRSGGELTLGERAADKLKHGFGSWAFLLGVVGAIAVWIVCNKTGVLVWDSHDLLLLNLSLSIMAGLQGGALQIASNRGDRISSELSIGSHKNTTDILALNRAQSQILDKLDTLIDQNKVIIEQSREES